MACASAGERETPEFHGGLCRREIRGVLEQLAAGAVDIVLGYPARSLQDGIRDQTLAALRALPEGGRPKVIFCTSKSGAHDVHKGVAAGANEWIAKPFDEAKMLSKLRAVGAA